MLFLLDVLIFVPNKIAHTMLITILLHGPICEAFILYIQNDSQNDEVRELIAKNDVSTLSKLFLERMAFGTAGLRGRMGVGFSQMNDLVIIQTAQGLLKYLQREHKDLATRGIVVGYDGRHNSRR